MMNLLVCAGERASKHCNALRRNRTAYSANVSMPSPSLRGCVGVDAMCSFYAQALLHGGITHKTAFIDKCLLPHIAPVQWLFQSKAVRRIKA